MSVNALPEDASLESALQQADEYLKAEQPAAAASVYQRVAAQATAQKSAELRARALLGLGAAQLALGHLQEASAHYLEVAQSGSQNNSNNRLEIDALLGLVNLSLRMNQPDSAIAYYRRVKTTSVDTQFKHDISIQLANLQYRLERYEDALQSYQEAAGLARQLGNMVLAHQAEAAVAMSCSSLGNTRSAIEHFEQAQTLAHGISDAAAEIGYVGQIGNLYAADNDLFKAQHFLQSAVTMAEAHKDAQAESVWLGNLANVHALMDQIHQAINCYQRAIARSHSIGDDASEARLLLNLGLTYAQDDVFDRARSSIQKALEMFKNQGDQEMVAQAESALEQLDSLQ